MRIVNLYTDKNESININSYLKKCGVQDVEEYLNPSGKYLDQYYNYTNIDFCVQEIAYWKNIEDSKIFIVQDADGDGVCSTLILYQYLKLLKSDWNISILLHTSKQRGLNDETIMDKIRKEKPNLVIVPDAGTNNKDQAEELCDLGIGLIVLDHHDFKTPIEKGYLVNNQSPFNKNIQKNGSGTLVVHKFLQALDKEFNKKYSAQFIDLVALSLISDSMDMAEMENRTYYHFGLETKDKIVNKFLLALFDNFIGDKEYCQRDISFKIVPKINSICRHSNMEYKQRLIMAFLDMDDYTEVLSICEQAHKDQIDTVNSIIENNNDRIIEINNNNLIVFASNEIPRSYSGLVCGKIMNICDGKPSIVGSIRDGVFIGSLRSPIPLRSELDNNDLVEWAEGHEESCGISIKEDNLQSLVDYYNTLNLDYTPCTTVLSSYSIKSIPNKLFGLFDQYKELWTNQGVPKPMFCINNITFNPKDVQIMGKQKRTLKIHTEGIDIIIFNCLKEDKQKMKLGYYENDTFVYEPKNCKLSMELIGELTINEWNGNKKMTINVDNYEISEYNKPNKSDIF